MNQRTKVIIVVLLTGLCFYLYGCEKKAIGYGQKEVSGTNSTVSSLADISAEGLGNPQELEKIKNAMPEKATVTPKRPRKLLVFNLCKGYVHSSIPYCAKALEVMGKKTGAFEVVCSKDMAIFKAENLNQFDAVCFNNTTCLDFNEPELRKSLIDFVEGGKGIIGIHAATDNFYNWPEAAEMLGGQFAGHPWNRSGNWAFKIEDPGHPINAAFGGRDFRLSDEIYRIKPFNLRKNCRVLVGLDMTDQVNLTEAKGLMPTDKDVPISWVRCYGKGRVFYCSLGHNHELFWNTAVLQHYLDGIQFAMGDLAVDTTPSGEKPATSLK